MAEVETHSSMPASLTGLSKGDGHSYPHGSQGSQRFGANHGSDGNSTPHNESIQHPLSQEGASPTSPNEDFMCALCPGHKPFAQKRGRKRHFDEVHGDRLECLEKECTHKWTRSREAVYRKHLREEHKLEDNEIDERLGRRARHRRRKGSVINSDPSPYFLPPPTERGRQSPAETRQRPQTPPPLDAVQDVNNAFPPLVAVPSMAYNPWLGTAEHLAPTLAPPELVSEEGYDLLHGNDMIHEFRFPSSWGGWPGGSSTANIPSNPGMLHMPAALPFPVDGYHYIPNLGDPAILEPVRELDPYQAHCYHTDIA